MRWIQGFDPGKHGASTLLSVQGGRVVVEAVWCWRDRQRGGLPCYEVVVTTRASEWRATRAMEPTLTATGQRVATQAQRLIGRSTWEVWQEQAHLPRKSGVDTVIAYAWGVGAVVGPVERFASDRRIGRVQAAVWRHRLLGLPVRSRREKAKAASLGLMPQRLPGLGKALAVAATTLGTKPTALDHITDSGGVAEFGFRFPEER